jgi:Tn3 transposase DDE domain
MGMSRRCRRPANWCASAGSTWASRSRHRRCSVRCTTASSALPDPPNLIRLKLELGRRWPDTSLLDMLKEVDLRIGFTQQFVTAGLREHLDRALLQKRLLLCLYALGTPIPASNA